MRNITRNIQENCVMARVMRQGKRHQRNYGLGIYKTWEAAEKKAAVWVRRMLKTLPPEAPRHGRMTVSNTSGIVGVHRSKLIVRKSTGAVYEYWRWTGRWHGCPNRGGVSWNVTEETTRCENDAFVLAVLSVEMKSVNRMAIRDRLGEIRGTAEFDRILELRKDALKGRKK